MPTSAQTTGETACAGTDDGERAGEGLANQRAEEERGEEQPATEAGSDRDRRCDRLQHHQQRHMGQRVGRLDDHAECTVPRGQHRGRHQGQCADSEPAAHRPEPARDTALAEQLLGQCHATHDGDADQRAHHAESEDRDIVECFDACRHLEYKIEGRVAESVDHRDGDNRGDRDRGEGTEGVGADHQLERVESAGQRRIEGAGDGGGRAAADQQAQIVAPDAEHAAEARRQGRADLGVTGLQPHRGADAVRQDRLQHDDQAVVERHAPAIQCVGLDRVDRAPRAVAHDGKTDQPDQQPAQGRARRRYGSDRARPWR